MPKFDASSIGDVEYDFTDWKGVKGSSLEGQVIDDAGVIPEPSRSLISSTMKRVSDAFKLAGNDDVEETPESIVAALETISDEESFEKLGDELFGAIGDLCDGHPRKESLEALGWRRFMAFFGYVMGEMMSPELQSGDTNSTQKRLRSV